MYRVIENTEDPENDPTDFNSKAEALEYIASYYQDAMQNEISQFFDGSAHFTLWKEIEFEIQFQAVETE
jgi:hypothetical protein